MDGSGPLKQELLFESVSALADIGSPLGHIYQVIGQMERVCPHEATP